jgi:hypothetical protein
MTSLSFFDADLHSISINQATLLEFENLSGPKANPYKISLFQNEDYFAGQITDEGRATPC